MFYCDRFDYTLSDNLHLGGGRDVRDYIPEEELLKNMPTSIYST